MFRRVPGSGPGGEEAELRAVERVDRQLPRPERGGEEVEQGVGVGEARIKQEAGDLEEADRNSEEEGGGGISTVQ